MRGEADAERIRRLALELGRRAPSRTKLYLTGGATAVLEGWRLSTVDVKILIEPGSDELLRAIAELKQRLDLNIELAAPTDFIPELPGWRERSRFRFREGAIEVFDFDLYSQALSKIERGFVTDLTDVAAMVRSGLVEPKRAKDLFDQIEPSLHRYPAIDPASFRAKVERALGDS